MISIFASRNRFGSLAGGALALSPSSGLDLLHRYAESWHLVSLGSAAPMPPWVALLGISSILTLGNLPLLLTLIFLFAPAITYLTIYRVLLRFEVQRGYALVGAGIYSASPLLWGAINQGRVGTLLVLQLFPTLLSLQPFSRDRERSTWRRTFSITLLTGVIAAFSPLLLITWLLVQLVLLVRALFEERHRFRDLGWATFIFSEHLDGAKRRFTLLITPWLLTFPWSASMLIHPTQIFLEPGISVTAGSRLDIALFNPGGAASVPTWILSPFIFFLVVSLIVPRLRSVAIAASALLGSALLISQLVVPGHGSTSQVWSGPLIAAAMGILLAPTIKFAQENIPTLVSRRLGFRHIGWSGLAAIIAFNLLAMPVWAVTGGANSLVKAEQISHVPAFVTALEQTPARPKTLVISSNGLQTRYFVTRGKDIQLGDADVVISIPDQIGQAMDELIAGSGLTSARTLGAFGIQYLYLQNPAPANIIRSVDGSGGFSRMSSTTAGIVWRIVGSNPRVLFVDKAGVRTTLDSNEVSAISRVNGPGVIQLAEKYDRGWRLLLDGRNIALEQSSNGLPFFTIPQAGEISLSHDGTLRRALLSVELITLTLAVVMALPAGRRRRELAEMQESAQ